MQDIVISVTAPTQGCTCGEYTINKVLRPLRSLFLMSLLARCVSQLQPHSFLFLQFISFTTETELSLMRSTRNWSLIWTRPVRKKVDSRAPVMIRIACPRKRRHLSAGRQDPIRFSSLRVIRPIRVIRGLPFLLLFLRCLFFRISAIRVICGLSAVTRPAVRWRLGGLAGP